MGGYVSAVAAQTFCRVSGAGGSKLSVQK